MSTRQANQLLASFLMVISTLFFSISMAFLFAPEAELFALIGNNPVPALMLGSAGAMGTAWSLLLFNSDAQDGRPAAMSSAAGLALLAYLRFAYVLFADAPAEFLQVELMEGYVFGALAMIFFFVGLGDFNIVGRFMKGAVSFYGTPRWVFIWVMGILSPVNMAGFLFLDHPIGLAASLSIIYVMLSNMPLVIMQQGVTRAMSFPHLAPFGLVVILCAMYLFTDYFGVLEAGTPIYYLAWTLLVVNVISLVFDILDSIRWVFGGRETVPPRGAA